MVVLPVFVLTDTMGRQNAPTARYRLYPPRSFFPFSVGAAENGPSTVAPQAAGSQGHRDAAALRSDHLPETASTRPLKKDLEKIEVSKYETI